MQRESHEDAIAVIGMACRLPGASDNPEQYWSMLRSGRDAIVPIPADRWDAARFHAPQSGVPGKTTLFQGGFLDRVDGFDAELFGVSPRELKYMDPQHRLALELAWEAIEDANYSPMRMRGEPIGVFLGLSSFDYLYRFVQGPLTALDGYVGTGNSLGVAAGRISYLLGLEGPSLAIDTSCSSSLVAIDAACKALSSGDCEMALAGGVSLILSVRPPITGSQANMLSPTGRCHVFDAAADGFVRGEGGGFVLLKALRAALRDRDLVHAVVVGAAVNQDGASFGLTVPNGVAQQKVVRLALHKAGVNASDIGYIEAHGTGTPLGDPIEIGALSHVFTERGQGRPLLLGSVKSNIGHLEAGAGIAGFIKTVLSVREGFVPPTLNFVTPNPRIKWGEIPVEIVTQGRPWPTPGRRYAGVSSFGFSGTNAHVIVADFQSKSRHMTSRPTPVPTVLSLAAKTPAALRALAGRYADCIAGLDEDASPDYLAESSRRRTLDLPHRLAVVGSREQLRTLLSGYCARGPIQGGLYARDLSSSSSSRKLAFVFAGQGMVYSGMGLELRRSSARFRYEFDRLCEIASEYLHRDLLASVQAEDLGSHTDVAQPLIACFSLALARYWQALGVQPDLVMGHSLGEVCAGVIAGSLDTEQALSFIVRRGAAMQRCPTGAMTALLGVEHAETIALAREFGADVAAINASDQWVLSGTEAAIQNLEAACAQRAVRCVRLECQRAFHSVLMDEALEAIAQAASQLACSPPKMEWISTLSGSAMGVQELARADYWVRQARQPVLFHAALGEISRRGATLALEIGPHPLVGAASHELGAMQFLPSSYRGRSETSVISDSTARLLAAGVTVGTDAVADMPAARSRLPTYPFQRRRHWFDWTDDGQGRTHGHQVLMSRVEWSPQASLEAPLGTERTWLVVHEPEHEGPARLLLEALRQPAREAARDIPLAQLEFESGMSLLDRTGAVLLVHQDTSNETSSVELVHACARAAFERHLKLARALQRATQRATPLQVVTIVVRHDDSTLGGQHTDCTSPETMGLQALIRTLRHELPDIRWRMLEVDAATFASRRGVEALQRELQLDTLEVRLQATTRLLPSIRETSIKLDGSAPLAPGTYLITGASSGIGCAIGSWLAQQGVRRLVLNARGADALEQAAAELRKKCPAVETVPGSVADAASCEQLLRRATAHGDLQGIFHAAGCVADGSLLRQDAHSFDRVAEAKVLGTMHLDRGTRALDLRYFVCFSSIAAVLGSPGQANYAFANALMDGVVQQRKRAGKRAITINWGPWQLGMTSRLSAAQTSRIERGGLQWMDTATALSAMRTLIDRSDDQVTVAEIDWQRYGRILGREARGELFDRVLESLPAPSPAQDAALREIASRMRSAAARDRDSLVWSFLTSAACLVAQRDSSEPIEASCMLASLGFDSLLGLELRNMIEKHLGLSVPLVLFAGDVTVGRLAKELAARVVVRRIESTEVTSGEGVLI
jgi:acyl transferase domain-containing protein